MRNKRLEKTWNFLKFRIEIRNIRKRLEKPVSRKKNDNIYIYTYIYIQDDNSLLTKRNEKVLKPEQIFCSQRLCNKIKKKNSKRARFFLLITMCGNFLIYPE